MGSRRWRWDLLTGNEWSATPAGVGFDWVGVPGVSVADDLNRPANRLHPSGMALISMVRRWGMEEMENG
jgi:hypothetical protein